MQLEIITKQDLEVFRKELLHELAEFMKKQESEPRKEWLRSKEVRQLLNISNGTLANLRVKGILHPSKIEGVYYYKLSEIMTILHAGAD